MTDDESPHPNPDSLRVRTDELLFAPYVGVGKWRRLLLGCALATVLCALITLLALWSPFSAIEPVNLVMIYLMAVVIVAFFYGRWPSVLAAVINVASFDVFFVSPRGTLAVSDAQYLVTFAIMLGVGLLVGNLTAGVRYQARIARYREQRVRQLYEMSKTLNRSLSVTDIARASQHFLSIAFHGKATLLLTSETTCALLPADPANPEAPLHIDYAIAHWSLDHNAPAGAGTDTLPGVPYQVLPLATAHKVFGVLAIEPENLHQLILPEQQHLLATHIVLIANALERLSLMHSAENARLETEREQLRNSLLAALSHDLRTPLTVLFGQAELLARNLTEGNAPLAAQADQIRQQILSTTRLVNNVLDMARIQSDGFHLRREWQTLDELFGSALHHLENRVSAATITVKLPETLWLVYCDAGLIERVLVNLLENALKYAGETATIQLGAGILEAAAEQEKYVEITVHDNGPGITPGQERLIFEKFARGHKESSIPGVGLGLAICHAIVTLHGGKIWASHNSSGGATFHFTLPLAEQPKLTPEPLTVH